MRLGTNRLSNEVPTSIWGLLHVYLLKLTNNSFSGPIARTIGGTRNLSLLILSKNNFSSVIPEEIGWLENLQDFSSGDNKFNWYLWRGSTRVSLTCSTNEHIITFWMKTNDRDLPQKLWCFKDPTRSKIISGTNCEIQVYLRDLQHI